MILSQTAKVKISTKTYNHYKNLGYKFLNCGDIIEVAVFDLTSGSHVNINVKCDVCGKEKQMPYKEYINNIKNQKYFSCSPNCGKEKQKITNIKRYNHVAPTQNKTVLLKSKKTCFKNNGFEHNSQIPMVKNKKKEKSLKTYGVEYPLQAKSVRDKIDETNEKKYGFKCCLQNRKIHEKQQTSAFKLKKHKDANLYYRGTYEKHFLDFCFNNKIPIKKGKTVKYFFKGKTKIYFSDFYLKKKNLIIEIKSSYTYKKYLDKNLAKKEECVKQGFMFIFIINKKYDEFLEILNDKGCF